jgi:hypothetical protein
VAAPFRQQPAVAARPAAERALNLKQPSVARQVRQVWTEHASAPSDHGQLEQLPYR